MLSVFKAALLSVSQIPDWLLTLFFSGVVFFSAALIVYCILSLVWGEDERKNGRLRIARKIVLFVFVLWWLGIMGCVVVGDGGSSNGDRSIYLIPFDPSSILIDGKEVSFDLSDPTSLLSADWMHQRRILFSLLNCIVFIPAGFAVSELLSSFSHRYVIASFSLLFFAGLIELFQYCVVGGSVYSDNVIVRALGALIGIGVHRLTLGSSLFR